MERRLWSSGLNNFGRTVSESGMIWQRSTVGSPHMTQDRTPKKVSLWSNSMILNVDDLCHFQPNPMGGAPDRSGSSNWGTVRRDISMDGDQREREREEIQESLMHKRVAQPVPPPLFLQITITVVTSRTQVHHICPPVWLWTLSRVSLVSQQLFYYLKRCSGNRCLRSALSALQWSQT